MSSKAKILFIGDYCRTDYISLLRASRGYMLISFLHFSSEIEEDNKAYIWYGDAIYWKDYKNAFDMLQRTKPTKVVFLFIDTFYQAAVNIACKELSIPTYHLEHGLLADYAIAFDKNICSLPTTSFITRAKEKLFKITNFYARVKSRLFLNHTIKSSSPQHRSFLRQFIKIRRKENSLATFRKLHSFERFVDKYISFSPRVFKVREEFEALPLHQKVCFIGVPYFDQLAKISSTKLDRSILFVDQPLAEQGLLEWDIAYKAKFIEDIAQICNTYKYKLYVKPHPKQNITLWVRTEQKGLCEIINDEKLLALAPSIPIILGFYSTLLMPFAAFSHTTLITFENHPAGNFLVSKPFTEAGVAHPIYNIEELHSILQNVEPLHQKQLPNKAKFTEEWMYKFDGKAGERLRDILLSDEL